MVQFVYNSYFYKYLLLNMTKNWRVVAINYKGVPVL